jgi:hypothetical protein
VFSPVGILLNLNRDLIFSQTLCFRFKTYPTFSGVFGDVTQPKIGHSYLTAFNYQDVTFCVFSLCLNGMRFG